MYLAPFGGGRRKAAGRGTRILRGGELSTVLIIRAAERGMAVKITRRLILDIFPRGGQVPAPGACMERWFAVGLGYAFFSGIRELFKIKLLLYKFNADIAVIAGYVQLFFAAVFIIRQIALPLFYFGLNSEIFIASCNFAGNISIFNIQGQGAARA